jgi:hypothetical protein
MGLWLGHLLAKRHGAQADGGHGQVALAQIYGVHGHGDGVACVEMDCVQVETGVLV